MINILLVEDQAIMRKALKNQLESHPFLVEEAATLQGAVKKIEQNKYDVILLDLQLPDGNGLHLFETHPEAMISRTIVITAHVTVGNVVEAIKKGAFNYLEKPVEVDLLIAQIKKIVELSHLESRYQSIRNEVSSAYIFEDIVYESRQMEDILARARILAKTDNAILIQGETGVGKEVLSHSIHNCSLRKSEVFLPINCAAIPPELFESELFGFAKGAFTGAVSSYSGRFMQADKGTLFLDEIGELPLHIQAKLLRIMDEKKIYPLKSKKALPVDIRLISATNKKLGNEVNLQQFRNDLYYRLKESTLMIPPLRERVDDILPLAHHYIRIYNQVYNKNVSNISRKAEKFFMNYSWKGNVRELKNTIKSIIPFKKNDTIDLDDLSYSIMEGNKLKENRFLTLREHEKQYILRVLTATDFNISQAAEILDINRPRLYRKIRQFQLERTMEQSNRVEIH
jgi:DNA-binding NtrC family response regulator